jgi:small subunit ribosomal protein S8
MAVHDPIADAITIVRNGMIARKSKVETKFSNKIEGILKILKDEGYIKNYRKLDPREKDKKKFAKIEVELKYDGKDCIITGIDRVSKPGLRIYASVANMPRVRNGLGIAVLSTSRGIMTDQSARTQNVGGEVLCYVW